MEGASSSAAPGGRVSEVIHHCRSRIAKNLYTEQNSGPVASLSKKINKSYCEEVRHLSVYKIASLMTLKLPFESQ